MNNYRLELGRKPKQKVFFSDIESLRYAFEYIVVPYAAEHDLYYEEEVCWLVASEEDIVFLTLQLDSRFRFRYVMPEDA